MPRPNVSEQKRKQIIDAFSLCFLEKPYEMITLKDIAAKAEIPSGSIYFYFSTKEEILMNHAVLFGKSFEQDFLEICLHIATGPLSLPEFAHRFLSMQRDYLDDKSTETCMRYLSMIPHNHALFSLIQQTQTRIIHKIAESLVLCQIPCRDPKITARVLYSLVDGVSLGELTQGKQDTPACYDEFVRLISHSSF